MKRKNFKGRKAIRQGRVFLSGQTDGLDISSILDDLNLLIIRKMPNESEEQAEAKRIKEQFAKLNS